MTTGDIPQPLQDISRLAFAPWFNSALQAMREADFLHHEGDICAAIEAYEAILDNAPQDKR